MKTTIKRLAIRLAPLVALILASGASWRLWDGS
jgi:hypothetical protein